MQNKYLLSKRNLFAFALAGLISGVANGQFQDCYGIPNWTINHVNGGNGSVNTGGAPASIVLTGPNGTGGNSYTHYSITVPATGTIGFNWSVAHSDSGYDGFGYSVNGANTQLTSTSSSGIASVPVVAGDIFTFYGHSFDGCCGTFNATISNLTHPSCCDLLTTTTSNTQLCVGDGLMTTLTAASTTGGTISWDGGISDGVPFTPPVGTTTYTATSTSGTDCSFSVDVVRLNPPTVVANVTDPTPCSGEYVTFTGSGATSYSWDNGITNGVPIQVTGSGFVSYTVTGTTQWCSDQDVITLILQDQPTVLASASANEICLGESVTLTSSGDADTYSWGTFVSEGVPIFPTFTTTYNVTGVDGAGCSTTSGVTVVVHELPVVSAGADKTICQGGLVTLSGAGAVSYTWNNGVLNNVPFNATVAGVSTYTVTGTDQYGCEDTDDVEVNALESPVITGVVNHEGNGFDGSIDVTVTGGTGNYVYQWSHGYTTEDASGLTANDYTIIVSDGICSSQETFTIISTVGVDENEPLHVSVYPNPTSDILFIDSELTYFYTISDMQGRVILKGEAVGKETVSIEDVADGSYVLTISGNNIVKNFTVIKN